MPRSFSETWTWIVSAAHVRDGRRLVLFFDVGVEAVVHHLAVGVIDGLDEPRRLRGRREEVDLEPIEVLDGDPDAARLGLLGGALERVDART